ncbi:TPA: retron Ec48 family effector membrane protein [Stenotrophomonas maltophilia]|uniref:retron Ec48 family effector membrane protein n=1 Tax=Stenotrophomonas maltophilia TaxID=40324 RepID=UPI001462E673|nr:retron Ec48 family effector membrane protein [Stenotrophomonas maltophilia]MBH1380931.1 hypothetical protein [Stenotrophomonas maltophilia]MBH1397337.1 hypothetical protein [Stenotrophomonas maltophilia]MBH1469829.1 hypothetical protein [Stenotrophomonas maltophilia]MBH1473272.1 hypothetical protein [Stenotrophomonas maltophilia]QJP21822.1 hypothetical protein HKK60_20570 [Stenotrophomonas maltophilia]
MNSLRLGGLVSTADEFLSRYLLISVVAIVAASLNFSIYLTVALASNYNEYELCTGRVDCYVFLGELFTPQIEMLKAGAALASLIMLVSGAYLAFRSYLSASQVGMFGNAISHVTFFERFVVSEISRRPRLVLRKIDVFAIYELMFPRSHANERFAAKSFTGAVDQLFAVIRESSAYYDSRKSLFKFDDHRQRVIKAMALLSIEMDPSARMDFLETEDDVIDFIVVLCRVFSSPDYVIAPPQRTYR